MTKPRGVIGCQDPDSDITPPLVTRRLGALIRANGELMQRFGILGTPSEVWKDMRGKINIKGGMPRLGKRPAITGFPEQKINDPALTGFR